MGTITSLRYYRSIFEIVGTLTSSRYYRSIFGICGNSNKVRVLEHKNKKPVMKTSFLIRFF
ncbi:hypothetical protein FF021_07565 [Leptospira noguchii]|nr:hypothetical protein FF021_07565 [Leptospira noguchii]